MGEQLKMINAITIWILKMAGGDSDIGTHFSKPFRAACKWSAIWRRFWSEADSYNLPHDAKKTLNGSLALSISLSVVLHNNWKSGSVRTILVNWRISWLRKRKSLDGVQQISTCGQHTSFALVESIEHFNHNLTITIFSTLFKYSSLKIFTKNLAVILEKKRKSELLDE